MAVLPPLTPTVVSDEVPRSCEHGDCTEATPSHSAFSFIVVCQCVKEDGTYWWHQCENEQHWACSHDHAVVAAHTCINECHDEGRLVAASDGIRLKLPKDATCAICSAPITPGHAWHMPVAYATPGKGFAAYVCGTSDEKFHPNHHWCCSFEHARTAAKACIVEHLSEGRHGRTSVKPPFPPDLEQK